MNKKNILFFSLLIFCATLFAQKFQIVDVEYNFVSYRLMGLSFLNQEQSIKECIKLFEKNFAPLTNEKLDYSKMYYEQFIPENLFNNIAKNVDEQVAKKMISTRR